MKIKRQVDVLVVLITFVMVFFSVKGGTQEVVESSGSEADLKQQELAVSETIRLLGGKVQSIEKTPVDNLFLVETLASQLIYVTGSGKHLFFGTLLELRDDSEVPFDLTRAAREKSRWKLLQGLDESDSINFAPADEDVPENAVVYVFTDVTCGYCRVLHRSIKEYNDEGIEIRYLAFPRGGVDSPGYDYLVSAWCADDPHAAMTLLKNNKKIEPKVCENPVADQHKLGLKMQVQGTPALILANGSLVSGFRQPEELVRILEQLDNSDS